MAARTSFGTAGLLSLIAVLVQAAAFLVTVIVGAYLASLAASFAVVGISVGVDGVVVATIVVQAVMLAAGYYLSFDRIAEGRYVEALDPTLVIALISLLLFVAIVPGICYLLAWVKLRDGISESSEAPTSIPDESAPPGMFTPSATAPGIGTVDPTGNPGPSPAAGAPSISHELQFQLMALRRRVAVVNSLAPGQTEVNVVTERFQIREEAETLKRGVPPEIRVEIDKILAGMRDT